MSVTMTKREGVTVLTMSSDPDSRWPPVCQILKSLCYSPVCCSVSRQMRTVQRTSLSVLGALQIMIGLLGIGLGVILRRSPATPWSLNRTEFPYWLGALFIAFGVMCVLTERFPSPCLVGLNVMLSLAGVAFAITAIVLYSIYIANTEDWFSCDYRSYSYYRYRFTTTSPPADVDLWRQKCLQGQELYLMLLRGIIGVMIVLSLLELCAAISSVVIGIRALRSLDSKGNKSSDDPELHKPLMGKVLDDPAPVFVVSQK